MTVHTEALQEGLIETYTASDDLIPKYSTFPVAANMGQIFPIEKFITDEDFDARCPEEIRNLSEQHWTRVSIARIAAGFLVDAPGTKVLDIGSGVGKFCIAAAAYSQGQFTGVEQRKRLCDVSKKIAKQYNLSNTKLVHSNVTDISFSDYDAFYFYNSFHENIQKSNAIDHTVDLEDSLYRLYTQYLITQLQGMRTGTRLVTYFAGREVPLSYELLYTDLFGALKFWRKR